MLEWYSEFLDKPFFLGKAVMETFFGYYFITVIGFSFISAAIYMVYFLSLVRYMSAKYPWEYQKIKFKYYKTFISPRRWKLIQELRDFNDDRINCLSKKALFGLCCCLSILITVPLGMIVLIILTVLIG